MQHLMETNLFETILPTTRYIELLPMQNLSGIFFVYPSERLGLIVLAVVVGVPLVRVLKKSFFVDAKELPKPPNKRYGSK